MGDYRLDLVDLDQKREGYRQFLSCWVYQGDGLVFIVDPGPRSTAQYLIDRLAGLGVRKLDFVLLTHIHLDHGGGAKEVADAFPEARVYCHESGRRHLVDPARLWRGSIQVLGEIADLYGEPGPVPEAAIATDEQLSKRGIAAIHTPGHAAHHVAFVRDDILFAGEAFGTRVSLPSGRRYLRPATPPRFDLDKALEAIDALRRLDPEPPKVAFAHHGLTEEGTALWCDLAREQLLLWVESIRALCAESADGIEPRFYERLMRTDPLYGHGLFAELPGDIQARERGLLGNTLDGMLGYIESTAR